MSARSDQLSFGIVLVLVAGLAIILLPSLDEKNSVLVTGGAFPPPGGGGLTDPSSLYFCGFIEGEGNGNAIATTYEYDAGQATFYLCPDLSATALSRAKESCVSALSHVSCPVGCHTISRITYWDVTHSCTDEAIPGGATVTAHTLEGCRQVCVHDRPTTGNPL